MSAAPLRLLLAGLGNRGQMWARIVKEHEHASLAAAVDPNPEARERIERRFPGLPLFATLEEALAAGGVDAVLLVTPPDGHRTQAQLIFETGLPLLAEKPLALDMEDARAIVEMADAARLPLMVGLNFRFLPVSTAIRDLLAEGVLGAPGFSQFTYQRNRDGKQPHLNKYPLTMRHPMMLEQSIHHLDLIRFCFGREVETVICRTWNPPWSMYAHDSNVHCLLTLEGGVEVNYFGTWTGGWNELQFQWRIDCTDGVIVQRQLFDDLAIARTADTHLQPVPLPNLEPFFDDSAALLDAFTRHVLGEGPLVCSGRDHLITLALCFAAIESSETGRAVQMADFCARHDIPFPA